MSGNARAPGPLEMAILEILWERGASTARAVHDVLARERALAYSTVLTVLRRMEAKGTLSRRKVSRSHVYEARADKVVFRKKSLSDLLARFFSGSPGKLIAHLVEEKNISADELARIEDLIAEQKKQSREE